MDKINRNTAAIIIAILGFTILFLSEYSRRVEAEAKTDKLGAELVHVNALKDSTVLYYKGKTDSVIGRLYEGQLRLTSERAAFDLVKDSLRRYKRLYFVAQVKLSYIGKDTITAIYTDTITRIDSLPLDSSKYIRVPRPFAYSDTWLNFTGTVKSDKVEIYRPFLNLGDLSVNAGWKRRGLFRKPVPVCDVVTNCPYLHVTTLKNAYVQPQKRALWDSRGAWLLYGILAKTALNTTINAATGHPIAW